MAKSDSPRSGNVNRPDSLIHARCSDVSGQKCDWQTSGRSEDEVLTNLEQHGRARHDIHMDNSMRDKARGVIRGTNPQRKAA